MRQITEWYQNPWSFNAKKRTTTTVIFTWACLYDSASAAVYLVSQRNGIDTSAIDGNWFNTTVRTQHKREHKSPYFTAKTRSTTAQIIFFLAVKTAHKSALETLAQDKGQPERCATTDSQSTGSMRSTKAQAPHLQFFALRSFSITIRRFCASVDLARFLVVGMLPKTFSVNGKLFVTKACYRFGVRLG